MIKINDEIGRLSAMSIPRFYQGIQIYLRSMGLSVQLQRIYLRGN